MAFRTDEEIERGIKNFKSQFIPRNLSDEDRWRSEDKLDEIMTKYGPPIDTYPTWHPLVSQHEDKEPCIWPSFECGYRGLDHTRGFVNAFITCPYNNGENIFKSVDDLNKSKLNNLAHLWVERLDEKFYSTDATSILVFCEWKKISGPLTMIPASLAIPAMLLKEVPCVEWSELGETWETMRQYFLGSPHGSRSSLFVDQNTAGAMKKIWEILINTGAFGPIKVSNQRLSSSR